MRCFEGKKFLFFGGKGGTGKTTCAAACAVALAERGVETLVVSTDPAHNLADVLQRPLGDEPAAVAPRLHALEIDPEREAKRYTERIKESMREVVSGVIVEELQRQIDAAYLSPGSEESAIFDRFVELMEDPVAEERTVIFDTAPTGHTLRLLGLPDLLGGWIEGLVAKRRHAMGLMRMAAVVDEDLRRKILDDPVVMALERRRSRFAAAKRILTDGTVTAFLFVLNPEKLPILETERALALLDRYGIPVPGLVVNRIIPPGAGVFLERRRQDQERYLEDIRARFSGRELRELPLLDRDVQGVDELRRIGAMLF